MSIKQQLKELIDKAFSDTKATQERDKMLNDLLADIPKTGKTSTYCKTLGTKVYKVGIVTYFDNGCVSKKYYTVNDKYESIDW